MLTGNIYSNVKKAIRALTTSDKAHADVFNSVFQDLIDNDVTVEAVAKQYTDQQVQLITESGIPKLQTYRYTIKTTAGQTTVQIPLSTFSAATDSEIVILNSVVIDRDSDYSINETGLITFTQARAADDNVSILVLKHVPIGSDGSVHGKVIADDTIELSKLSQTAIGEINKKGTWLGDTTNALTNLDEAPDGVFPFTETSTPIPKTTIYGNVLTMTGRNSNFRVQLLFEDNASDSKGVWIRKKTIQWNGWYLFGSGVGDVTTLTTRDKSDLTNAINSVHEMVINGLVATDTRNTNENPEYYYNKATQEGLFSFTDFKSITAIGLAGNAYLYARVETKVPYTDPSGGGVVQVAYSNGEVFSRTSSNLTTWTPWIRLINEYDYNNINASISNKITATATAPTTAIANGNFVGVYV